MEEERERIIIKLPQGALKDLKKLFGRGEPYVRAVLRDERRYRPDASRIRQAALKMGGVELKEVKR
jgi:hypothetical protein